MAVPEQTPYIEHIGNGATTSFALEFQCESKDHLIVLVDEIEPPIASWSLVDGNVVFTIAPAVGKKITLQRNTPFSRTTDYQSYNNSFRPPAVNKDFDWIWLKLQELGVADWILGDRIDALKNYVDRKDDELKAYLMEEIRKQGVALDQLDEYYNYLMERLAQIAVDKGWDASFIVSAEGSTQQQINDRIGNRWYEKPLGYELNARVQLANGDIVKSTVANNTVDPNVDMTGWENFEADQKEVIQGIPAELATYAALRSYTGGKMIAVVGGRSNYLDGGFGRFAVKASDTISADNDGTILVDAKGRRWHRIIQTEYGNPEWFGMSESVADNAPLVEKCLNIVSSAFIRKGDFPIQNTLRVLSGQTLIGLNDKSSFVMNDATKGVIITHDGIANKTQPNVTIKGIRAKGTALYGFGLTHCTQSNFEHLSVDGITAQYGFIYESFWNTHIKDHKTNGAIITNTCFAVNKIVLNTEFDALYSSNAAPYNIKIDSGLALISNNTWAGFGDLVFTGAAFQGATKYALSIVAGTGITFNTAYMENCLGALHIGFAQDVVFNLCGFVGLKSGQSTHSMWLGSNSSNTMNGITFNQCKFPAATYPVVIDYAGAGVTFNQPRCVGNIALSSMIQRTANTLSNMPVSIYRDADSTGATADVKKTNNGAWKLERATYNDTGVATRTIITPPETTATMIPL